MDDPAEVIRRVTGLLEVDAGLSLGALTAPGRGTRGQIFGRYLAAYIMVERFGMPIEKVAIALKRDRGTVTQAMKVFRFLHGYSAWREALETFGGLSLDFVAYGEQRSKAAGNIPAPVGRDGRNDKLPAWVREQYAREIEAVGEDKIAEARKEEDADTLLASHPAVRAITDDPIVQNLIGKPVVSVTISPPEGANPNAALLLVPPVPPEAHERFALRLLCKAEPETIRQVRFAISKSFAKINLRVTGAAESFPVRDRDGWRYIPLHIAPALSLSA